jgi:hypothetical protein
MQVKPGVHASVWKVLASAFPAIPHSIKRARSNKIDDEKLFDEKISNPYAEQVDPP